jgi:biopolymer transport protein TolR
MFTGIDATAFASVLAVVVFILWIAEAANPMVTRGVSADPPRALHSVSMPGALREDVMQDGQVYLGADRIWSDDLTKKIQDRLKDRGVERKVYVVADMRARWGTVKSVLDCIRSAGILRVAFMVNQRAS